MAINRNRELSQVASVVIVDDANKNVGIATTSAPKVGIGTTNPAYKLDVYGAINSNDDVPLTTKEKWRDYRQQLRDITKQADPFKITWPTEPS